MRVRLLILSLFSLLLTACGQDYCIMGIGPCAGFKQADATPGGTTGGPFSIQLLEIPVAGFPTRLLTNKTTYQIRVVGTSQPITLRVDAPGVTNPPTIDPRPPSNYDFTIKLNNTSPHSFRLVATEAGGARREAPVSFDVVNP